MLPEKLLPYKEFLQVLFALLLSIIPLLIMSSTIHVQGTRIISVTDRHCLYKAVGGGQTEPDRVYYGNPDKFYPDTDGRLLAPCKEVEVFFSSDGVSDIEDILLIGNAMPDTIAKAIKTKQDEWVKGIEATKAQKKAQQRYIDSIEKEL